MTKNPVKAGPPEKEETAILRMAVSIRVHEYLGWLSRNTMLGASENDVARFVLTEALKVLRKENYSEQDLAERTAPLSSGDKGER